MLVYRRIDVLGLNAQALQRVRREQISVVVDCVEGRSHCHRQDIASNAQAAATSSASSGIQRTSASSLG